jgi:transcription elongation factor Elf1
MDQNLLNILKNLSENMHCPGCGKKYSIQEVQFMGQNDGQVLLQLSCESCKMPVWVNVIDGKAKIEEESALLDLEAICSDDLINFHNELMTFDGNFKKAFRL